MPNTNLATPSYVFGFAVGILIFLAVFYVMWTFPLYKLFKKAGQANAWLAFIPIGQYWPLMGTIRKSARQVNWCLLPFAGAIFLIVTLSSGNFDWVVLGCVVCVLAEVTFWIVNLIWYAKLFQAFGLSAWFILLLIGTAIPFVGLMSQIAFVIMLWMMALQKQYTWKFRDNDAVGGGPATV